MELTELRGWLLPLLKNAQVRAVATGAATWRIFVARALWNHPRTGHCG